MHHFLTPSRLWLALAVACFSMAATSLILTNLLHLHPCYLCVFQRLLYILMASFALVAALSRLRLVTIACGILVLLGAGGGAGVASYQVWLQSRPGAEFMCSGGDPNTIERIVIWLNEWASALFQATGNCASKELVILGLSLAGWSLVGFIASLSVTVYALWKTPAR